MLATTTTDANGLYAFAGLKPGNYNINVVKPAEYIASVQANQYHGPDKISGDNGLIFDGLVSHVEIRW